MRENISLLYFRGKNSVVIQAAITLFLLFNTIDLLSISPSASLDSLKACYYKSGSDTNKISLCCQITFVAIFKQTDSVELYAKRALSLAENHGDEYYLAIAYQADGLAKWNRHAYSEATESLLKAYNFAGNKDNPRLRSSIAGNMGLVEERVGDFPSAVRYGLEVYKYSLSAKDTDLMIKSSTNVGNAYNLLNESDSSSYYYNRALDLSRLTHDIMGVGLALNNLARNYIDFDRNYQPAINAIDSALIIFKKLNYKIGITRLYTIEAAAWYNLNNYDKTLIYIDSAYKASEESNDFSLISKIMELESVTYYDKKDYKRAYDILKKFIPVHDSIQGFTNRDKVDSMLFYYREQYKDKQIKLLEIKSKQSRIFSVFLLSLIVLLVLTTYLIFNRYKSGKKMLATIKENNDTIESQKVELEDALKGLKNQNGTIVIQNTALENLNEELKSANALKDRFLAIIAHDLRNPIGAMKNLTDLVYTNYNDFEEIERHEMISNLKESSQSVYELLENLLTWSRIHRGRVEFHPEYVLVHFLVDNTINPLQLHAKAKNITIENNTFNDTFVYADPNMLSTIIRNIVSNALKFSPEDTTIQIKVRHYNSHSTIAISDNGIGIKPESLHKLFESEGTSMPGTSNERGTGLGLVLCKEFVDIHGGKIWVQSIVGKGSTFYFTLPNGESHETTEPAHSDHAAGKDENK